MPNVPYIYTDSFESELQSSSPDLISFYEEFQEGKVGFEFKDSHIEIDADFAENTDPDFLRLLLKTLRSNENNLSINAETHTKPILHTWATGIEGSKLGNEIGAEQDKAQYLLDRVKMLLSQEKLNHAEGNTKTSQIKTQYLKAIMDSFNATKEFNTDKVEINKQGETVYVRDIMHDGEVAGSIKYLETDSEVTILRSDVIPSLQQKGLGTSAYKALIDEKIGQGKLVKSDNIVSKIAQRIYSQLANDNYGVIKQPSRKKYREDVTTILPDTARKQVSEFPTVLHEGVRSAASGYRLKGEPVYTVHSSPNALLKVSPIQINVIDTATQKEVGYAIYPNKVEISYLTNTSLDAVDKNLQAQVSEIIGQARNVLSLPENEEIKQRISDDKIGIWEVTTIERGDIEQALTKKLTAERTMNY